MTTENTVSAESANLASIPPDSGNEEFARWVGKAADAFVPAATTNPDPAGQYPPENTDRVDRDLVRRLGTEGFLPALFPGAGAGAPEREAAAHRICAMREELARRDTHAETAFALQGLGSYPVVQSGTPQQRDTWVTRAATGEAVAAFALSEPEAGSDAAALRLRAEPDGSGWRLRGEKMWISNAPEADFYTVFARTTPEAGARGVTAFLVPADRAGLSGQPLDMLSPHALGHLTFDGVAVSPDDVIGEVDRGFRVAMRTLDLFRPSVGAFAVGMARAAIDAARTHVREREAFDGTLADLQTIRHTLAEMATRTEAARLLVYSAATEYDTGGPDVTQRAAMAKLFATEAAQYVVDAAVQLHGARALRRGHPLENLYREVRAPRIYEGATEVQREIIARQILA